MQLMNKSMNFSVRAYHAILSLFFFMFMFVAQQLTYSQICSRNSNTIYQESSSVFLLGGSSKKLERSFWRWEGIFDSKQRIYHRKHALLSRIGDPHTASPTIPSRFPLFSLFLYLGGCKINRWYSPHLDFHFFHIWEGVKLLDVIPPTSSKNILDIYKYCISPPIVTIVQTTLLILCFNWFPLHS